MSPQKDKLEDSITSLKEEDIADYLRNHQDYFERYPDVLGLLRVPSARRGDIASFAERQVDALRLDRQSLVQQFEGLVENARLNERREEIIQKVAIAAAAADDPGAAFKEIPALLAEQFQVDFVTLRCSGPSEHSDHYPEVCSPDDPALQAALERVSQGRGVCDDRLPAQIQDFLFADRASEVSSCALAPLVARGKVCGVIGFGTLQTDRFQPTMGTLYLDRLGEIIGSALERLIEATATGEMSRNGS
ncbi:MAG: DUF484 family protein [Arenicellales bacterium]|jgi:hypothetical protein|nr:hypothetical protein [Acidiferrobacteraceae bacterium]MDP6122641.1 DUF484 family protein [Arenicellales bacterium]MDP6289216.1 DUF484 family protein [Arenicellales bacterium]MDP6434825.1 DUF484 family protein [Arenicellales bacterium]MDP6672990.1 DUF484 family protein [Arenicellales bacterium]|tara:strand:- start:673 stop:1416 length:744 start_codon:yes stop_codon:yes gene_type:complete